jgi:hypothetical protein
MVMEDRELYHVDTGASADNNKPMYAGRVVVDALGSVGSAQSALEQPEDLCLSVGANAFHSNESPTGGHSAGTAELKKTWGLGGDLAVKMRRFAGTAEIIRRRLEWWDAADAVVQTDQTSFSAQGGVLAIAPRDGNGKPVHPQVEGTLRYEYVDYDQDDRVVGPVGENSDSWVTVGANVFLDGHNLKIQANYILKNETMPAGASETDNDTFLMQLAVGF